MAAGAAENEADRILRMDPEDVIAVVQNLTIVNREEAGLTTKWPVNEEQKQIFRDVASWLFLYVLKVRQIGSSTAFCADHVIWTSINDTNGQRVRTGIIVDTEAKVKERISVCMDFCEQLGLGVSYNRSDNTITFPGGSEIMGITAGGRRAGASMTFHRLHFTELPFYRDPTGAYVSLMQALVPGGQCIIETTMGLQDMLAKELWQNEDNAFFKRFFSFEDHIEYRMDPFDDPEDEILTDEWIEHLTEEGFTDERAMRDWVHKLHNKCGGDVVKCWREYPQKPEHSWMFAEGRWVRHSPKVLEPRDRIRIRAAIDPLYLDVFVPPVDVDGDCVIGVDTSAGMGRDSSAVAVVECRSNRLLASFKDEDCKIDDLIQVAKYAQEFYSHSKKDGFGGRINVIPKCVIEVNGMGEGAFQEAITQGMTVARLPTTKVSRYDGLLYVKRAVESGYLYGPQSLANECDELMVEDGKFKGPKDLMMAIGFCYTDIAESGSGRFSTGSDDGPTRLDMTAALEAYQRKRRKQRGRRRK